MNVYLSCLLIDVGEDPDRERPGRKWLRNLYHVHQRLCMAFPSKERQQRDEDFLDPWRPEDFPEQRHSADRKVAEVGIEVLSQVHAQRGHGSGFLFRVDPGRPGRASILVQSGIEPRWGYAFRNADHLLAAPAETKSFAPRFQRDQRLNFRLLVNPTRRLSPRSLGVDGQPVDLSRSRNQRGIGKRVPVPTDRLYEWIERRAQKYGFAIDEKSTTIQPGYVYWKKPSAAKGQRLRSVRYDGILNVIDSDLFERAIAEGIGSAKAFGFGLLSVAPVA